MLLQDIYSNDLQIPFEAAKLNTALVKQIQTRLKDVGLYFGAVDSIWGNQTDKALEEFCKRTWVNNFETQVIGKTLAELLIEAKSFQPTAPDFITKERVEAVFNNEISDANYQDFIRCITTFGITTKPRVRHFLSQAAHESGGGRYTLELASGAAYEGRKDLGNTVSGYGRKYRGSGYIQVTGFYHVKAFSDYMTSLGKPDPEILNQGAIYISKVYPWSISGHWWFRGNLNARVDQGFTCRQISRIVNGTDPANGLADREMYYARALKFIP